LFNSLEELCDILIFLVPLFAPLEIREFPTDESEPDLFLFLLGSSIGSESGSDSGSGPASGSGSEFGSEKRVASLFG